MILSTVERAANVRVVELHTQNIHSKEDVRGMYPGASPCLRPRLLEPLVQLPHALLRFLHRPVLVVERLSRLCFDTQETAAVA